MDWNYPLQTAQPPVTMLTGYQTPADEETTLTLHCHDQQMRTATATSGTGTQLFHVAGAALGTSWSWRRKVYASTTPPPQQQQHLFDLRHASVSLTNPWVVENAAGERIGAVAHNARRERRQREHSAVDATVREARTGEDVRVVMRQADAAGTAVAIVVGEATVAVVYKMEDNPGRVLPEGRCRSVWKARVAPATDLSLVGLAAHFLFWFGNVFCEVC